MAETAGTTAETWEQDARTTGEGREIIGGVDATVLARRMVGFQDWPTGSLGLEDLADDRPWTTWKALVDERLKALRAEVLSRGSNRAQACMQRAEKGWECLRMPDGFPGVPAISKNYVLALGPRLRQAHKDSQPAGYPGTTPGVPPSGAG